MRAGDVSSADAAGFAAWLDAQSLDYLLVEDPAAGEVHLRFVGCFEGRDVVWDCRLLSLQTEVQRLKQAGTAVPAEGLQRFIEIGAETDQGIALRVGLEVECIDRPTIEKTIVMIRNYRRLHRGRHEYGKQHPVR